jgi:ABC-type nickel/cobalt efflux system permease component RcnA
MSKETNGNFTNFMMALIAAPVVLAWVGLAVFLVIASFRDPQMVTDIESYKSVLLIVGSPALVIIYKVLELWTAQQNSDIEQTRKETFSHDHDEDENGE